MNSEGETPMGRKRHADMSGDTQMVRKERRIDGHHDDAE